MICSNRSCTSPVIRCFKLTEYSLKILTDEATRITNIEKAKALQIAEIKEETLQVIDSQVNFNNYVL